MGDARNPLFYREAGGKESESFEVRWQEVRDLADLRPGDRVLDVGCAEGLISLEVARLVERVDGFDVSPERVAAAAAIAAERHVTNASFTASSVADFPVEPRMYDVSLFLGVWGERRNAGAEELRKVLAGTRRQALIRVGVQDDSRRERWLREILAVCDECGFDALCFSKSREKKGEAPRGNMIVANRRGTDARLASLPPLALVPTALLADHPVVASARSETASASP